jgi:hypothetical protein
LASAPAGETRGMSSEKRPTGRRFLKGLVRKIASAINECRDAQRRMDALVTSPDTYSQKPDTAPDTYAEFLFRTSGLLQHEPSARGREHGALRR